MSIRENKFPVPDLIIPQHALVSVFDKSNLDTLVHGLLSLNPRVHFYSTGGTGKRIIEILDDRAAAHYTSVETFINMFEMEGGLVKTLHPKIHAGLLAERGNPAHRAYLEETLCDLTGTPGKYFDVMVGNLYPFTDVIAKPDCTPEKARINIDIGGPAMIMAAAKNWQSVAVLTDPAQYEPFLAALRSHQGIPLELRFHLAQRVLCLVGDYRSAIANYFSRLHFERDVLPHLHMEGKSKDDMGH